MSTQNDRYLDYVGDLYLYNDHMLCKTLDWNLCYALNKSMLSINYLVSISRYPFILQLCSNF